MNVHKWSRYAQTYSILLNFVWKKNPWKICSNCMFNNNLEKSLKKKKPEEQMTNWLGQMKNWLTSIKSLKQETYEIVLYYYKTKQQII